MLHISRAHVTRVLAALGIALVAACHHDGGDGNSDGGLKGLTTITVSPAMATLTINGTTPVTQAYTASGTFADGHTLDLTNQVTWSVNDGTLGSFSGAQFTSGVAHGGIATILATLGGVTGAAQLNLVFSQRYSDPGSTGLPTNPSMSFGGMASTADSVTPHLVYPNDNVVVPPNLGTLEFHFTPSGDGSMTSTNTLFELSFENAVTDIKVYLRCPVPPSYTDAANTPAVLTVAHGCIYISDPTVWTWIAETNRGGSPLAVSVRGTTDANGPVGTSATAHVSFTYDDIQGAIYYWEIGRDAPCVDNTPPTGQTGPGCSDGDNTAIVRYDFAGTAMAASSFLTPTTTGSTGGTCLGCHALSHDGTKLVAEAGGQGDGRILLWNVAMESPVVPFAMADRSFFESWSPDGTQYVGVNNFSTDASQDGTAGGTACTAPGADCDFNLRLYDGTTSKFTADIPNTSVNSQLSDHPDWSADGNSIAYTSLGQIAGATQGTLQQAYAGSIYVVTKTGSVWSAPTKVVAGPDDHTSYYYPAFSPDGKLLVFNQAVLPRRRGARTPHAGSTPHRPRRCSPHRPPPAPHPWSSRTPTSPGCSTQAPTSPTRIRSGARSSFSAPQSSARPSTGSRSRPSAASGSAHHPSRRTATPMVTSCG